MTNEQIEMMKNTNAFYNVSFDPDKRIDRFISGFAAADERIKDLCQKYGVDSKRICQKHFDLAMNYLYSQSRCMSWAITGPARFPVAKAQKRNNACEQHMNKFVDFENNIEKLLNRITRKAETEDDKKTKWIKKVEALKARQELMKKANALLRKKDITALVALVGETAAAELQKPDFCGRIGFADYELRNNLANIKRLEAQILQIDNTRENKAETGFSFEGGKVEFDAEEIRFNIFFDEKPAEELRTRLKSRGFKWSPRRSAWTRGAKTISIKTIKEILNVE